MSPLPFRNLGKQIILCWILFPLITFCQVKIKEKVEITPKQSAMGVASGDFRVECTFSGPIDPDRPHLIYARGPCSTTADAQLPGTISLPAYAGGYLAGYRFSVPVGGGGTFSFKIYLGADILQDISFPVSAPNGATLFSEQSEYFYSGFTIEAEPRIVHGLSSGLSFQPQWSEEPCVTTIWHGIMPVSLTIASGAEFGEFIDGNGQPVGRTVATTGGEFGTFRFVANGIDPGEDCGRVVIQASSGGINALDTIKIVGSAPIHHFVVTAMPDTIAFNDFATITAVAVDAEGNEVMLDENTSMNLAAAPNTTGSFYPDAVVTYGDLKSGYVLFWADRTEPATIQEVIVNVYGGEKSGTGKVVVTSAPCIVVQLTAPKINPGGRDTVLLWSRQWDGSLKAFDSDQIFTVWTDTDEKYGRLRSGWGEEGTWIFGPAPFEFIAADSIDVDTVVVIEAAVSDGGATLASRDGDGGALWAVRTNTGDKLRRILKSHQVGQLTSTTLSNQGEGNVVHSSIADDNRYSAVLKSNNREGAAVANEVCTPRAQLVISKDAGVFLSIVRPSVSPSTVHEITAEPSMPALNAAVQLHNSDWEHDVYYFWRLTVKWIDRFGYVWEKQLEEVTSSVSHSNQWEYPWGTTIVGGDEISVDVRASAGTGNYTADPVFNPYKIQGRNPSKTEAISGLDDFQRAVMYHESRYRQFDAPIGGLGFPLVGGKSADYGMMQINISNKPTVDHLWNWKINKSFGLHFLADASVQALAWPSQIKNDIISSRQELNIDVSNPIYRSCPSGFETDEQRWKETYSRYNGGSLKTHYWIWRPADENNPTGDSGWIRDNLGGSGKYADIVWGIYNNKPADW